MKKRIAIIPARGGSKRLPDKNIIDFCGRPMIAYTLDAARRSELFDTIHVSTESLRIIQVVEDLGFSVDFPRPVELSDDHTPIMPVLKYVTETYRSGGKEFDQICLISACAPLIEPSDLKNAEAVFNQFQGRRSVLAVTPYPVPIEWALERKDDGIMMPVSPGAFAIRSQDLRVKYHDIGAFAFFAPERVLNSMDAGSDADFIGYVLPRTQAIDIDEPEDMVLAEALYRERIRRQSDTGRKTQYTPGSA